MKTKQKQQNIFFDSVERILGFYRTMPVVGRKMDIRTEFFMPVDTETKVTFFRSPSKNVCFFGNCSNYCEIFFPVCGNPYEIEGAFISFLPELSDSGFTVQVNKEFFKKILY